MAKNLGEMTRDIDAVITGRREYVSKRVPGSKDDRRNNEAKRDRESRNAEFKSASRGGDMTLDDYHSGAGSAAAAKSINNLHNDMDHVRNHSDAKDPEHHINKRNIKD